MSDFDAALDVGYAARLLNKQYVRSYLLNLDSRALSHTDIKLAHDQLMICLKHLSLASNQTKTNEEAATKVAPIYDYVEHVAKTCVTDLIWQFYYDDKATASTDAVSSDATGSSKQPADKANWKVEAKEPHFEIFSWKCFSGEMEQQKVAEQNDAQKSYFPSFGPQLS